MRGGLLVALGRLGQNFHVEGFELLCFGGDDTFVNLGHMNEFGGLLRWPEFAFKVPEIGPLGKGFPAFTFDVAVDIASRVIRQPGGLDLGVC